MNKETHDIASRLRLMTPPPHFKTPQDLRKEEVWRRVGVVVVEAAGIAVVFGGLIIFYIFL